MSEPTESNEPTEATESSEVGDRGSASESAGRLFVPAFEEGWRASIKRNWDREYCFTKHPDDEFYHLLMAGEMVLQYEEEKYCMACAMRRGLLSRDRLHWRRDRPGS